jgi:hypothetical protein
VAKDNSPGSGGAREVGLIVEHGREVIASDTAGNASEPATITVFF